jgi:flagellar protein FlgJ
LAVFLPSDIVLDVARAVEPATLEAARAKLASRTRGVAGPGESFAIGETGAAAVRARPARADATPEPYKKFEAMVLSTFVQNMMPKHTDSVFGEGVSGDMWKSLMAQQLGTVTADRGGIGIADSLLKDRYADGDTKVALSGVSSGPEKVRHDQERNLSAALVNELQRRFTADIAGQVGPTMTE